MNAIPSSFLPRTLSTAFLWLMIIVAYVLRSEVAFIILISFPALGALWEYFALLKSGSIVHHRSIGMGAALLLIGLNFWALPSIVISANDVLKGRDIFHVEAAIFALLTITLLLRELGSSFPGRATADSIVYTLFGVVYIPWLFLFMAKLLYFTPRDVHGFLTGQYLVLFVVAVTKFTDVGAFLCGSLFGRTPFFPNISPKKTWEGIAGALVLGVLAGVGIFYFFGHHLPHLSLALICGLSLLLGIAGIAGDLAESILKRSLDTKDSGHALPGIGGGLDLIDSLLFTLPLFYFLLPFLPSYP